MKALILIAAGLLSSGAIAQSTMGGNSMGNSMGGATTGSVTRDVKTTTRHTATVTRSSTRAHRDTDKATHRKCMTRMRDGHKVRVCKSHMKPTHHKTTMHRKVTIETKKPM